ncbi:hypothetical protein F2Q70_00023308 [Brassica cretica]|uniref:Uncharacterized protein n=1 Tax=Brassica cretica TaxID=69181 RepID=A0A8S9GQ02_BRACR|nr:hypothetical protein F2Q70_00023308 [Brassica cretica]
MCLNPIVSSPCELRCSFRSETGPEQTYAGGVGALFNPARVNDCVVCSKSSFVASCGQLVRPLHFGYLRHSSRASYLLALVMTLLGFVARLHRLFSLQWHRRGLFTLGSWLLVLKGNIWRGCARESFTPRCLHLVLLRLVSMGVAVVPVRFFAGVFRRQWRALARFEMRFKVSCDVTYKSGGGNCKAFNQKSLVSFYMSF